MTMRIGLHALGIGPGAERQIIDVVARGAERRGFATLWSGEHVVMVDTPKSRYPYAADGRIAVPPAADWIDPMVGLSFAAAATSTIRLATGVLLLPEHNPVVIAKQVASLDRLSGGRLTLGVGIGWSAEEFEALGVPFAQRAERTAAYVGAMRTIWTNEISSYDSEFVRFRSIRVNPKPRQTRLPIVVGGNSDRALERVVEWGDGWYGFNLDGVEEVADRLQTMHRLCVERGRDQRELDIAVALRDPSPAHRGPLSDLGVDELVLVDTPPSDTAVAAAWIDSLATRWL